MSNRFTQFILVAMVLGIIMGAAIYNFLPDTRGDWASSINLIAVIFLRLIKMIIAPLVFATLVGGIAHMGSGSKLGRIFAKTMGWFVSASFVSLLLGLVMVNLLQPGANFPGTLPDKAQSTGLPVSAFSFEKFLTHLIPISTASSEAAYPKTLEGLNRFGASSRISAFVLPLGYSFNLDGTMMYCTFASIFIAQTYHIDMSLGTQLAMLATLMITSKGVAGVPRASLVVIASTLSQFGIPEAGLFVILGVDTLLDLGRRGP